MAASTGRIVGLAGGPARTLLCSTRSPAQVMVLTHQRRALTTSKRIQAKSEAETSSTASSSTAPLGTPSPLSPKTPERKPHSKMTVFFVTLLGRLMGYNSTTSTAIRTTSELYDRCAERAEAEADFWYNECGLPRSYQTWFQITNLHVHLLLTRFRALSPPSKAQAYSQELINHYFIDAESRMRERFGVQTSRLVKGYLREMHAQQRGALLGLDEALSYSVKQNDESDAARLADADAALATALWRNLWGAGGWGEGVGGVKRKVRGIDRYSDAEKAQRTKQGKKTDQIDEEAERGLPDLARDSSSGQVTDSATAAAPSQPRVPTDDLRFAVALEKLVEWYRRETVRLAEIDDVDIENGRIISTQKSQGDSMEDRLALLRTAKGVAEFSKI